VRSERQSRKKQEKTERSILLRTAPNKYIWYVQAPVDLILAAGVIFAALETIR
jgi:hypothetical protein